MIQNIVTYSVRINNCFDVKLAVSRGSPLLPTVMNVKCDGAANTTQTWPTVNGLRDRIVMNELG